MIDRMQQHHSGLLEAGSPMAILRLRHLEHAVAMSCALRDGGITALEFPLTNAKATDAITQVRQALLDEVWVGAGTVLDAESASRAIGAGAQFLVTPAFLPGVIDVGLSRGIPVICGAYTPTEILAAWQAGATFVKVFPAGSAGPSYIRDLLGPFPDILLIPTGGVTLENCAAFLAAGAYTVAVGSHLVNEALAQQQDWKALTRRARHYVEACTVQP